MGIVFAGIAPHPPLLIPEVGGREIKKVNKSVMAMKEFSRRAAESEAEVLIVITPHGPVFKDAITVFGDNLIEGDFTRFGAPQINITLQTDMELLENLEEEARHLSIPLNVMGSKDGITGGVPDLDHGAGVPLYYLYKAGLPNYGLHITFGLLTPGELFQFGRLLGKAVEKLNKRTALIASGDLSHRLTRDAPAGYDPQGREFDNELVRLIGEYDVESILGLDPRLIEAAGECGYRSFIIGLGALEGLPVTTEILSYEGPFGVGYLVATFNINTGSPGSGDRKISQIVTRLARQSIEHYFKHNNYMSSNHELPYELTGKSGGVFVSLKKKGNLRGCIGTVEGVHSTLADEIITNAVSAGFRDPRFPSLKPSEVEDLTVSVDILSPMERVGDITQLDHRKYGVLVRCGARSGLLLPDLEGVNSVEEQLGIACEKGGITSHDKFEVYRFTVTRHSE